MSIIDTTIALIKRAYAGVKKVLRIRNPWRPSGGGTVMMAIDTNEDLWSMLNFGDGTNDHLLFYPIATIGAEERQHLLGCLSDILFSEADGDVIDVNTLRGHRRAIIMRTRGRPRN